MNEKKIILLTLLLIMIALSAKGRNLSTDRKILDGDATPDITRGLVAHWSFDNDVNGTVIDQSPNQLHGSAYNIQYEDGPVSTAAVFDGTSSRIDVPDMHSSPPDAIGSLETGSISLWFTFQNQGGDILPLLYFGESDASLPHKSLILEIGHNQDPDDRRLYFTIVVAPFNVTKFCFDTGFNLEEDTWYHFAAVVGNYGNTGYLNGEELVGRRYNLGSNATYTDFFAEVTAKKQLSLGYGRYARNSSFFHFKGSLDDVRIYNRPLSLSDVRALYNSGSSITSISEGNYQHINTRLLQNYPNPFSLSTTISWHLENPGNTTIDIYDMMGRKVKTLVNQYYHHGNHNVKFSPVNLSPGVYYYQLQNGNYRTTKTMMLIR